MISHVIIIPLNQVKRRKLEWHCRDGSCHRNILPMHKEAAQWTQIISMDDTAVWQCGYPVILHTVTTSNTRRFKLHCHSGSCLSHDCLPLMGLSCFRTSGAQSRSNNWKLVCWDDEDEDKHEMVCGFAFNLQDIAKLSNHQLDWKRVILTANQTPRRVTYHRD